MEPLSNKLIIIHHTLPFSWKMQNEEIEGTSMSLKGALGRTPSVTDLSLDPTEDPFPHLYTEYSSSGETFRLADLNKILDEHAVDFDIVPNRNHPTLFESNRQVMYVGWPGGDVQSTGPKINYPIFTDQLKSQVSSLYAKVNCHPVFLKPKEAKNHFEGYCKNRLWSVLHYSLWRNLMDLAWEQEIYDDYVKVNREYAAKVRELWRPGDFVLVIGYHLLLVPQILKESIEDAIICTFIPHIWPSSELFRCLPQAKEIISGILASNFVGFQGLSYARHFMNCALRITGSESVGMNIEHNGRKIPLFTHPRGVSVENVTNICKTVESKAKAYFKSFGGKKIIIGIESADHMRAIKQKLLGFEQFLQDHPEFVGNVILVQVVTPDIDVDSNAETRVMELVNLINGKYGSIASPVVLFYYNKISEEEYFSLLQVSDVYLNTAERDSVPSTVLDFILAQADDHPGQLILSEFVALASYLQYAYRVNPWDKKDISNILFHAFTSTEDEKRMRTGSLKRFADKFTLASWSHEIIGKFEKEAHRIANTPPTTFLNFEELAKAYKRSNNRVLFLDYDGTLVQIEKVPEAAAPDADLLKLLQFLSKENTVYVVSGRKQSNLDDWLGGLPINLGAEHGAFIKDNGREWHARIPLDEERDSEWKMQVMEIFEYYTERTPGSFIEQKKSSITWHYRLANQEQGLRQAKECMNHIESNIITNFPIQLLGGKKNVEVRLCSANKAKGNYDFVLCVGDDSTDEDMFKALQQIGCSFTCLVGAPGRSTLAKHHISSTSQLLSVLKNLVSL